MYFIFLILKEKNKQVNMYKGIMYKGFIKKKFFFLNIKFQINVIIQIR